MRKELIAYREPKSPTSEMFRNLRTNIQFMASSKQIKSILITSTLPAEGKSWVAANLAVTFAQAGRSVILVDSDMRKGRVHSIFGTERKPGLSNYLSGIDETGKFTEYNISTYLKPTEVENLFIIPAGNIPPNPSELLVTDKAKDMIRQLRDLADIIIFDGTPSLLVTDAIILSRYVDTTIIVTAHKETKIENLQKVKKNIKNVGGRIAGVVLNKIPMSSRKRDSYYYYGSSQEALVPSGGKEKIQKSQRSGNRAISKSEKEAMQIEQEIAQNKARLENMIKQNTEKKVDTESRDDRKETYRNRRVREASTENMHKPHAAAKQLEAKEIQNRYSKIGNDNSPRTIEATIDTTSDILEQLNKYLDQEKANIRSSDNK